MSRRNAAMRAEESGIGLLKKGSKVYIKNGKSFQPQSINPRTKKPYNAVKLYRCATIVKTKDQDRMYTIEYERGVDSTEPVGLQSEQFEVPSSVITSHDKFCRTL